MFFIVLQWVPKRAKNADHALSQKPPTLQKYMEAPGKTQDKL